LYVALLVYVPARAPSASGITVVVLVGWYAASYPSMRSTYALPPAPPT
jgi:hypothetical protein